MPKLDIQKTNIILVGNWNVAILTPQWMQEQFPIFKTTNDIPIEIGINVRDIRYELKDILVNPRPDKLIISPKIETNDCFGNLITLTDGILEKLSHTPLAAVGANFSFILKEDENVSNMCGDSDELYSNYDSIGKKYSGTSVTQHLLTDNDKQITIYYHISTNERMILFNYNKNVSNKNEAQVFIKSFIKHYEDARNIVNKLLEK